MAEDDPNQHVREYLEFYLGFQEPPGFAVLLNGKWGTGKTYLVKKILRTLYEDRLKDDEEPDYAYVSLYGISSVAEFDDAVLKALIPGLGSAWGNIGYRAAAGLLKKATGDADAAKSAALELFKRGLYVFDDLERCDLPLQTALGYINRFVEHQGKRVIIIGNEAEVNPQERDLYRRVREKLIGKVLKVAPALNEALPHFIASVRDERTRRLFEQKREVIRSIFRESTLENLRILQQSIWDFERIYRILESKYGESNAGVTELLRLFLATSFEVKAGNLIEEHLMKRREQSVVYHMRKKDEESKPPIVAFGERYKDVVDLTDPLLSDEALVSVLIKGHVDKKEIEESLDRSIFYLVEGTEPTWRTIWFTRDREDSAVEAAIKDVEKQFREHQYTVLGELLHVFGLRLFMASTGLIPQGTSKVATECKAYVDHLYKTKQLEPLGLHTTALPEPGFASYNGLQMYEADSPTFKEIYTYLVERRERALEDSFPGYCELLLKYMKEGKLELLYHRLNTTALGEENWFYQVPVLSRMDVSAFVDTLLSLPPKSQRKVISALEERYIRTRLKDLYSKELPFAEGVQAILSNLATKAASPVSRLRLARHSIVFEQAIARTKAS